MRRLRVGLVGLGGVAEIHLQAYKGVEEVEVVAGAERREDRLSRMAAQWGIKGYVDFEEMLEKEKLDIVCVLTPARSHREVTEKAAEFGVHVLCEKPLAVTLEDAAAMVEGCKKQGVKLCYGSSYRFLPACRKAKEMIAEGRLGDISLLMEFLAGGQGYQNWRDLGPDHYPAGGPGGGGMGLVDHGIHLADIFRWLAGSEADFVVGRGNYSGHPPQTEFATMIFKSGAVGQLIYNEATYAAELPSEGMFSWGGSWDVGGRPIPGGRWNPQPGSIRVYGRKGSLRICYYANTLFFAGEGGQEQVRVLDRPMPFNFAGQMESFARRLQEGLDPEVSGIDGVRALQVVLAAYESWESGSIIRVEPAV
jgi:predicted dehydrogenase